MEMAFKSILSVILGNFIYALTVTLFLVPSQLVTGGTTGIALTVNHIWGISISGFVLVFNILNFHCSTSFVFYVLIVSLKPLFVELVTATKL